MLAFLLALLAAAPAAADSIDLVASISVVGARHVHPGAVERLMTTRAGQPFDAATLAGDLARLRATGILTDLSAERKSAAVVVTLKDRWSLLPVFGLRRGGGRTTARVGVSDYDAFGELAQLYGEVTSNSQIPFVPRDEGDRLGSYLFGTFPRLFGTRFQPGVFWTREFLDFSAWDANGRLTSVYDRARHLLRGEARYEWTDLVSVAASASFLNDGYSPSTLSPGPLPRAGRTTSFGLELQAGVIEEYVSMLQGTQARFAVEGARRGLLGSDFDLLALSLSVRSFLRPLPEHNLALQLSLQTTTAGDDSHLFRAGGLRELRGFPDAYFAGRSLLRANVEYRVDVLRNETLVPFVGQVAAFTDGGWVGARADAVSGLDYRGPVVSAGAGLRAVLVPIARAVGRVDLAFGLHPRRTIDLSLGGQQFF